MVRQNPAEFTRNSTSRACATSSDERKSQTRVVKKTGIIFGALFFAIGIIGCKATKYELGVTGSGGAIEAVTGKAVQVGTIIYRVGRPTYLKLAGADLSGQTGDAIIMVIPTEVTNVGSAPCRLDGSRFSLVDRIGNEYSPSLEDLSPLTGNDSLISIFKQEYIPNNPSSGVIAFEVPSESSAYTLVAGGGSAAGKSARILMN